MRPTSEPNSRITSNQSSSKKEPARREMLYHESREHAYNRQKDLHKDIEIDVPELVDKEETPIEENNIEEDSMNDKTNHSNVSVRILQEYQMTRLPKQLRKSMSNSKTPRDNQPLSGVSSSTQGIFNVERKIEDLYKWQERINKKHEVQREFQEQIRDSMYDYKVYTNEVSNQLMANKRPNDRVENLLMSKGKAKDLKIKELEQKIYGKDRVPSITDRAKKIQHEQSVHQRLYELDKSRREKSKEALSRHQSQTNLHDQRSKSETKRKSLYSVLQSPPTSRFRNVDFFFSPRDGISPFSPNTQINKQLNKKDAFLSPQASSNSPLNTFLSPIYKKPDHFNNKDAFDQNSMEKSREDPAGTINSSPSSQRRTLESVKTVPLSIYKRLTPSSNKVNASEGQSQKPNLVQQQNVINRNQIPLQPNRFDGVNINKSIKQNDEPTRPNIFFGSNSTENKPVLPNMLFFKNTEKPVTPSSQTVLRETDTFQKENIASKQLELAQKSGLDIKSMEMFWEKILQDDFEGRGRKQNEFETKKLINSENDGYECSQFKLDLSERNKLWMEKKNLKLDAQRRQKQQQELQGCTFKPHLYTQEKQGKNHHQQLYNNFLNRIGQKVNQGQKNGISPLKSTGEPDLFYIKSSGDTPKEFGNTKKVEDNELQKKLYNYILNSKN